MCQWWSCVELAHHILRLAGDYLLRLAMGVKSKRQGKVCKLGHSP